MGASKDTVDPPLTLEHEATLDERGTVRECVTTGEVGSSAWFAAAGGAVLGAPSIDGGRYEQLGLLGAGGMGEVFRARDRVLRRVVAMKVLRVDRQPDARAIARFVEEAQLVAQLNHPGVVPIFDLGLRADGRWCFTMAEVEGRTLSEAIREQRGLRGLIDIFHRICETMAYCHARGLVHRDLKPDNIMLGTFGRVYVLDWGIARLQGDGSVGALSSSRQDERAFETLAGAISGTPSYMSPEQAWGEPEVGPPADVYALGSILYHILSGRPPYGGDSAMEVLNRLRMGPPPPLPVGRLPAELVELCHFAMDRDPVSRPPEAGLLAEGVKAWLDGARRTERARALVAEADRLQPEWSAWEAEAQTLRSRARALLAGVPRHAPVTEKQPGWTLEAEAEVAEARGRGGFGEWLQFLHGALTEDPELPEAHARLAAHYHAVHAAAEMAEEEGPARAALLQLRLHDDGRYTEYIDGGGWLSLDTEPPGAEVVAYRFIEVQHRLEPREPISLGRSPVLRARLPMGSYLLRVRHPDRPMVELPVLIGRREEWQNLRPGEAEARPLRLLEPEALGPEERYVPAGWFVAGDARAPSPSPRQRLWVDSFAIDARPVTNREFIRFLNDLIAQGRETEALRAAPGLVQTGLNLVGAQHPQAGEADRKILAYGRTEAGDFCLRRDDQGDLWQPDWPVMRLDWWGAMAYARWRSAETGHSWRLPGQFEWEKAARGVDGRIFPWGDRFDATWCRSRFSLAAGTAIATVDETPDDVGPYGVLGMAGNVADWCLDGPVRMGAELRPEADPLVRPRESDGPTRWIRGGTAGYYEANIRLAWPQAARPEHPQDIVGFRLLRPLP